MWFCLPKDQMAHNLDIQSYSLDELLGLFDLGRSISAEDIKLAKRRVLMLHPDKSHLESKYFLFYKRALDVVVQFYETQNRQNRSVTAEQYQATPKGIEHDKSVARQISKAAEQMGTTGFQDKFNRLFEENMAHRPDPTKNAWFKEEKGVYDIPGGPMDDAFTKIKAQQQEKQQQSMIAYRGVQEIRSSGGGASFYDDDDSDHTYVASDPFSKLKYDDLRKVHKDQTVFAVSEADFSKVPQYASVDHFVRARGAQSLEPLDKQHAQRLLEQQEKEKADAMMKRQYQSTLQSMKYQEKNKSVMASFLHIGNG